MMSACSMVAHEADRWLEVAPSGRSDTRGGVFQRLRGLRGVAVP